MPAKHTALLVLPCIFVLAFMACTKSYLATLSVESDPPGARIEVDDEYMGTAPLSFDVPIRIWTPNGCCVEGEEAFVEIRALPTIPGCYTQSKTLYKPDLAKKLDQGQRIIKLIFDMRLEPIPKSYRFDFGH
jgi:hypothetical protein